VVDWLLKALGDTWLEIKKNLDGLMDYAGKIKQEINKIIEELNMFTYSKGIVFCPLVKGSK